VTIVLSVEIMNGLPNVSVLEFVQFIDLTVIELLKQSLKINALIASLLVNPHG